MSKTSSSNVISKLFGNSTTKNKSVSRSSSFDSKAPVSSESTPKNLPGLYGIDLSKLSSQKAPLDTDKLQKKLENKASFSSLVKPNNSTGLNQPSFNMNGFLGILNKSEAVSSQNVHLVLKKNQERYAQFKANLLNEKDASVFTPKNQLNSTNEESSNQIFEFQPILLDSPKGELLKYGPYETLVTLYEAEKTLRKNFEDLHKKTLDELNEIKKKKNDSLESSLRSEVDDILKKAENEIENLKNEIKLLKEKEERNFKEKAETENNLKNDLKLLKDREEKFLKEKIEIERRFEGEKQLLKEKECTNCKAYISEIDKLRSEMEISKKNNEKKVENNTTSLGLSLFQFKCKNCEILKQQMSDCNLEYNSKINQLERQSSLEKHALEEKIDSLLEIKESSNQSCSVCEDLRLEITNLQNLVSSLKSKNSEINFQLKQKLRESDHFECHTLLKRTATKISPDILMSMNKDQLLESFKFLKKEYEEMSQKLLSQADEMFEKKVELVQLRKQKTQLYNELMNLKSQLGEMYELREHAAYLLNLIGSMQDKIKAVGESYKDYAQNLKGNEESDEYKNTLNMISDMIKLNIHQFSNRRSNTYNWNVNTGKENLIQYLKFSILGYIKNNNTVI